MFGTYLDLGVVLLIAIVGTAILHGKTGSMPTSMSLILISSYTKLLNLRI
ncbi:hypothetical protein FACS1894160_3540 [Bacteroidia bacterium]|nr:hypothetical protein FACS1894123_06250 [Bacteroidia bacterium]GHV08739.1 hypothetical protein FACS1894160_3540 [Bacteroidia bacterium]